MSVDDALAYIEQVFMLEPIMRRLAAEGNGELELCRSFASLMCNFVARVLHFPLQILMLFLSLVDSDYLQEEAQRLQQIRRRDEVV